MSPRLDLAGRSDRSHEEAVAAREALVERHRQRMAAEPAQSAALVEKHRRHGRTPKRLGWHPFLVTRSTFGRLFTYAREAKVDDHSQRKRLMLIAMTGQSDVVVRITRPDLPRRAIAGLLFLLLAGFAVATYVPGGPRICREQLTSSGGVVELCRPLGTDDLVAVGLILALVLLLLAPDLSEFGIGGLFNVKLRQRIAAAERKADAAAKGVAYVTLGSPTPSIARIQQATSSASSKSRLTPSNRVREPRSLSHERQDLEVRLVALANELDAYVGLLSPSTRSELAQQEVARRYAITNTAARNVLQEIRVWGSVYEDELSEWARIRNTFVHYPERLSDDETRAAIALAERLVAEVGRIRLGRKTESHRNE